jgi:hypothetical protein
MRPGAQSCPWLLGAFSEVTLWLALAIYSPSFSSEHAIFLNEIPEILPGSVKAPAKWHLKSLENERGDRTGVLLIVKSKR